MVMQFKVAKNVLVGLVAISLVSNSMSDVLGASSAHYYYQGDQIGVIDTEDKQTSALFVGKTRIGSLDSSAMTQNQKDLKPGLSAKQYNLSYYLGDGKSQHLLLEQHLATSPNSSTKQVTADYRGYGQNVDQLIGDETSNFGYNSEYQDPLTNLTYLRARDYTNDSQRFVSMDNYHLWNRYNFVDANPIINIDSTGHLTEN